MSQSPIEHNESLRIGTVEFVSPSEIMVLLEIDAPDSISLNTGSPRSFPRVNSYVLIPNDEGFLVGQVEWLTIERSNYPKRGGMKDFGLVDLPYPLRKMRLNPLGTLRKEISTNDKEKYSFKRGADTFPSVGDSVLIPTDKQLRSIIESGDKQRINIGISPLAGNARVSVDPDKLFGRHLAVLGNTGSGKSCSVAGLIRWSLEAAKQKNKNPNARFIVLDPNGEYARAFKQENSDFRVKIFKIDPGENEHQLKVPLWFWNSAEWSSFTQATQKTQKPLLKRALREVKIGKTNKIGDSKEDNELKVRRFLSSTLITIQHYIQTGKIKSDESRFGFFLRATNEDLENYKSVLENEIGKIQSEINQALTETHNSFVKEGKTVEYFRAFREKLIENIISTIEEALDNLGGIVYYEGPDENTPIKFNGKDLADHLDILAKHENVSQYLDFLISRIRTFLSDKTINSVVSDEDSLSLAEWLESYIGKDDKENIIIFDLSLVPSEIVDIIIAVSARMISESLQRYRKIKGISLPTTLVIEEAHNFIKKYKTDSEYYDSSTVVCQVFEKIAKEGRKFGLGLVISSQRPSELSPTVLSQCNTFLLHRISNDRDQDLVQRFVPDNLRGLFRELPSLPSQNGILLGWASELPTLVRINNLPEHQRPQSEDPDFWNVWISEDDESNEVKRKVDWKEIADDWQNRSNNNQAGE